VNVGLSHPIHVAAATLSYPSGHVTFVAALGVALVALARRRWTKVIAGIVMLVVALVVGASRLYLGLHYPSDIVGAILNGAAGTILFIGLWNLVIRAVQKTRRPGVSRRRVAA
jgi:undecaprenyl-diphosphatase